MLIDEKTRAFLEAPHFATMATINRDGSPQLTVMWYSLHPTEDVVLLNASRGLLKERNLRRDPRVSVLVNPPDAPYGYAAIRGTATLDPDAGPRLRDERALKYVGAPYAEHVATPPEARSGGVPVGVRVRPEGFAGRL